MTTFWDPLNTSITSETIVSQEADKVLVNKYQFYRANPNQPRVIMITAIVLPISIWLLLYFVGLPLLDIRIYFISLLPAFYYFETIQSLEEQLTELIIANENGWLYDPTRSTQRWSDLVKSYPEIFQEGSHSQYIKNQFWGSLNNQSPFWIGNFTYTIGYGRSQHTETALVYAFQLPHRAAADFVLTPQSDFLLDSIWHPTLTTEWQDFNQKFHIEYKGQESAVGANIFEVLTPTAQELLVNFRNARGPFNLLFRDNAMFVSFRGNINLRYTDFLRRVALDPRDAQEVKQNLTTTLTLAEAILPCID